MDYRSKKIPLVNEVNTQTSKTNNFNAKLKNKDENSNKLEQNKDESKEQFKIKKYSFDNSSEWIPESFSDCQCSQNSSELNVLCEGYKSKPKYTEEEIEDFVNILKSALDEYLSSFIDATKIPCSRKKPPEFYIVPVVVDTDSTETSTTDNLEYCSCSTETETEETEEECGFRKNPIAFRHYQDYLLDIPHYVSTPQLPFKLDYVGKCQSIGKWGQFVKVVDLILEKRDKKLKELYKNEGKGRAICCNDICILPSKKDKFDDLNRFKDIELYGFSTLCISLLKWTNCTTKRWYSIINKPHIVIHLPSMSYPCHLRCKINTDFNTLQNTQIGRIGWLVNSNADVIYVYPGKSSCGMRSSLIEFVKIARPDVSFSRLWIIINDDECLSTSIDEKIRSGCENLFYSPSVFRRVRHLSAGRSGFIIPGILSKTDLFIACELKTPIIGPCLKFQERLLDKHYVMSLLVEANIQRPPFFGVRNLPDLCKKIAEMMSRSSCCLQRLWLLKINCGFCSNQSAILRLEPFEYYIPKEDLIPYLFYILPQRLQVNKMIYKDGKDFLAEMKKHGAVLMAYPPTDYQTVSFGFFIEHDTAKVCLRTVADVVRKRNRENCSWSDVGYIIPQTILPIKTVKEVMNKLGDLLTSEQFIGFFGADVVVFRHKNNDGKETLHYWVVDIDPYYTDLLSFDDWRRFCLNISQTDCYNMNAEDDSQMLSSSKANHRFVVCSGKLYIKGLSIVCQNFLLELCEKNEISYSFKAKTGCMIYPIDNSQTTFLLFSFYRSRELALKNFVVALKALYNSTVDRKKFIKKNYNNYILELTRDMEITYKIAN